MTRKRDVRTELHLMPQSVRITVHMPVPDGFTAALKMLMLATEGRDPRPWFDMYVGGGLVEGFSVSAACEVEMPCVTPERLAFECVDTALMKRGYDFGDDTATTPVLLDRAVKAFIARRRKHQEHAAAETLFTRGVDAAQAGDFVRARVLVTEAMDLWGMT